MMKILIKIYNAVHFFLNMVVVYYIISSISVIYGIVSLNGFNIQSTWAGMTCLFLNAKLKKLEGSQEPVRNEKALILVNHRSWSDFFIHDKMMDYTANFLARYLVAVAFPISLLASPYMRTLWYFNRDAPRKDFKKFYKWCDDKWAASKRNNLLVYPEGHRMFDATKPGPLKKGMIIYAYERKLPVQIAICVGNENLIHEKNIKVNRGSEMSYFIDKPIKSTDYQTFESFLEHLQKRFGEVFELVYQAHYKKDK